MIPINYITSPCIASIDGANIIASRLAAPHGQHKYRLPPLLSCLSTGERWDRPHAPYQHAVHAPCSESRGSCAGGTHPSSSVLTWSSWARCGSSFASAASPLRAPAFMSARARGIFDRVERVFEVGRGRVDRDVFVPSGVDSIMTVARSRRPQGNRVNRDVCAVSGGRFYCDGNLSRRSRCDQGGRLHVRARGGSSTASSGCLRLAGGELIEISSLPSGIDSIATVVRSRRPRGDRVNRHVCAVSEGRFNRDSGGTDGGGGPSP